MNKTSKSKKITVTTIRAKDRVRQGQTFPGDTVHGISADIVPGESIRLYGAHEWSEGQGAHAGQTDITFKVGDDAEEDSYNLIYIGRIVAIGPQTVTFAGDGSPVLTGPAADLQVALDMLREKGLLPHVESADRLEMTRDGYARFELSRETREQVRAISKVLKAFPELNIYVPKERKLSLYEFARRNWDFDATRIAEHNGREQQCI